MTRKAQLFIASTIFTGASLLIVSVIQITGTASSAAFLPTALLALFASTLKVRLPGIHGTISVNFLRKQDQQSLELPRRHEFSKAQPQTMNG